MNAKSSNTLFSQGYAVVFWTSLSILFFFFFIICAYFKPRMFQNVIIHSRTIIFNGNRACLHIIGRQYFHKTFRSICVIRIFYQL